MAYSKTNENPEDKTKELLEKLENGIKDTMNSEKYKAFLKFQSQFHNYSFNNQMLIYLQRPDATYVSGFKSWEKLDRHVMKGEKGISILAPNNYTYKKEVDKIDPKTNKPVRDPITGEIQKESVSVEGRSFRKVSVFDVKQTDGKELPSICNELKGNSLNAENVIKAVKNICKIPIIEKVIESGAKGYYSRLEDLIAINKGMALDQTAKTLIHEYAHSQLHNTEAASLIDRATKEVQAESVAYIVSNRFGVDTSQYSFDYLANWSSGRELKELKQSFDLIQKTADSIIVKIENVLNNQVTLNNLQTINATTVLDQSQNIKDKIIKIYSKELSSIKYVSEKTTNIINNINEQQGRILTIKEIKALHDVVGKKLETSNNKDDLQEFKTLTEVVEDIKHSSLVEKQEQTHEKVMQNPITKSNTMDMIQ